MSDGRKVLVLNGPNLNRLGKREPEIYGAHTLADLESMCVAWGKANGLDVQMRQTNHEGQMIDWLHEAADDGCPVVLNAAGWTHTSVAIGDACAQLTGPLFEVHISNVHAREAFRHHSYVSPYATGGIIVGMGLAGYTYALDSIVDEGEPDLE
ncbi:type II 3-dehydroquinate dehydratase [Glycomyces tritici]|uniref:3-dehydroquinate dehydratase n=1 Tax=Glycomyces tritici TaxID=2665176 RepID=A0ABT7YKT3_9ACTN|nr:type II 3-dehydroquinate dehydratase [Glycomyces tritici]MDN3239248.1 type II 3-dehydroquinate dehydratase [Glycomyces tritici]